MVRISVINIQWVIQNETLIIKLHLGSRRCRGANSVQWWPKKAIGISKIWPREQQCKATDSEALQTGLPKFLAARFLPRCVLDARWGEGGLSTCSVGVNIALGQFTISVPCSYVIEWEYFTCAQPIPATWKYAALSLTFKGPTLKKCHESRRRAWVSDFWVMLEQLRFWDT